MRSPNNKTIILLLIPIIFFFKMPNMAIAEEYSIVINEIMASNSHTILDESGDYPDWIELYNYGEEAINLQEWGLSDDDSNHFKWTFPDITIEPGGYLLVFASGKDIKPDAGDQSEGILREVYQNITGASVNDLLNSPDFPANPSFSEIITDYFEAPHNVDIHYGQRMHGILTPPETGEYTFWIASDDNSRLYISTDEKPANRHQIASVSGWTSWREWDKYAEQQSDPILLTQGQEYYFLALMKEHEGGDNLSLRWQLPGGEIETPIPASHFSLPPSELHTNFSISSHGEPIILTHPSGEVLHRIEPVSLPGGISYGLNTDRNEFLYFNEPTPGSANTTSGYNEYITQNPFFSHIGGFYTEPFELSILADDPGIDIYYTLDGSEPIPGNTDGYSYQYKKSYPNGSLLSRNYGKTYKYSEPIVIEDSYSSPYELAEINPEFSSSTRLPNSNIYKGTVVRVVLAKDNALPSKPETHTYFITDQGTGRYDIPVISISTNEPNLFSYESGIYVPGKVADEWHSDHPWSNWDGASSANYNRRGREWERPAHFEFFPNGAQPAYRHNIGIRIHGGWSREHYIKSFRLYTRNVYDDSYTFEYPFFGELKARGNPHHNVETFRRLILRNSGNDHYQTMYRDALMQELVKHLPFTVQAYQPVVHFINGEYWGIINMRERYDQHYIASHFGLDEDDVVILEVWGSVDAGKPADRDQFYEILNYAENNQITNNTHYEWVKNQVDIESLAQYYAAQIYFNNTDWPQNNMTFWRKRTETIYPDAPYGHDGKWRWMLYDTDFGMSLYGNNYTNNGLRRITDGSATDPSSRLFRRLLLNNNFKERFANIVADQLNTCFQEALINSTIDQFNNRLENYRDEHYNRWSSGTDTGNSMKVFARERPSYVFSQTRSELNLSHTSNLTISKEGDGGMVQVNTIKINEDLPGLPNKGTPYPWSGSYFQNLPIKLKAINTPGYEFSHWDGMDNNSNSAEIEILLSGNTSITAVFNETPKPEVIHYWHFNNLPDQDELINIASDNSLTSNNGEITYPGSGNGYMDGVNDGTSINLKDGYVPGQGLRVRNPSNTRDLIISIPTTDFQNIVANYAIKRTSNGAQAHNIYYQLEDNGSWNLFREHIASTPDYQLITLDFSEIREINNNADFKIKLTFTDENAAKVSGNNRLDNISVEGVVFSPATAQKNRIPSLNIFPNPTVNSIRVISKDLIRTIEIYNIQGKLLKQENTNDFTHQMTLNELSSGIYIVTIKTDHSTTNKKIVKK